MTAVRQGQKPMFLHWQSYTLHRRAPLVRKGAAPMLTSQEKRWSCEDVVKEALRVKGWCSHVRKPMQPLVTHHDSPDVETIALPEWIARTMKSCREESGAQLRKNTVALQTFIASVPQDGPRIEDLRAAAVVVKRLGRRLAPNVKLAMVVPGSGLVKQQAEAEGLDKIFTAAGFEWREPGCSMCLAMNADRLEPGERCASTSNRNFEGRQGQGGRTHLVSPAMAAAAAVHGHFVDIRQIS